MKTMTTTDFTTSIVVNQNPRQAFDAVGDVSAWWAKNFKGNSTQENGVFTVTFGETYVEFKIIEYIPEKRVVWLVTDCFLHWLNDKKEWNGTRVVWDIVPVGNGTEIVMTHIGIVPEAECYNDCSAGWDRHIRSSLYKLITEGTGLPS